MEPVDQAPQSSHPGAAWLNGIIWAIMVACFLWALALHGYEALIPFFIILLVAGLGAIANLITCLWLYATSRGREAAPYLIGFVPLALLTWWLLKEFSHVGKIGG